jgi:uncharacterized membrane protein YraQ (UPF0718 family)
LQTIQRWSAHILIGLACLSLMALIYTRKELPDISFLASFDWTNFKTLFISILLEAIPFVLLGVLTSALLQIFVSEQTVRRLIPSNPIVGVLFACLLGLIFPLCECGMIPIVRRLMLKGMPLYIAVVFILVGPILNPVVFAATYMAFRSRPEIAYSRMGLAFLVAFCIGILIFRFYKRNPLRGYHPNTPQFETPAHSHGQQHQHSHTHSNKLFSVFGHASDEFFEMGKYLIFGAILTACIQTLLPRESLVSIGQGDWSSNLFMMGFAYILSLCSTSDAFVASSFAGTFTAGSLLTFLVFGPMLDFKNTLMLLSVFRGRFVLLLSSLIVVFVLAGSLWFESFIL